MNKNKYFIFISIGFELVGLILAALWLGQYLRKNQNFGQYIEVVLILGAFLVWFISLMLKLKNLKK